MRLGAVLKTYRLAEGLSLRGLAKTIDIDYHVLERIENGRSCSPDALANILFWLIRGKESR